MNLGEHIQTITVKLSCLESPLEEDLQIREGRSQQRCFPVDFEGANSHVVKTDTTQDPPRAEVFGAKITRI